MYSYRRVSLASNESLQISTSRCPEWRYSSRGANWPCSQQTTAQADEVTVAANARYGVGNSNVAWSCPAFGWSSRFCKEVAGMRAPAAHFRARNLPRLSIKAVKLADHTAALVSPCKHLCIISVLQQELCTLYSML